MLNVICQRSYLGSLPWQKADFLLIRAWRLYEDHRSFSKYSYIFLIVKLIDLMPDVKSGHLPIALKGTNGVTF